MPTRTAAAGRPRASDRASSGAATVRGRNVRVICCMAVVETDAVLNEIERTALHLGENAADIFPDDAEPHELDAGREQDGDDDGWITRNVGAEKQSLHEKVKRHHDREQRQRAAHIGPDAQRQHAEGRDRIDGEGGELAQAELRASVRARFDLHVHDRALEAGPGDQAAREALALAHVQEGVHDAPVEQHEVAARRVEFDLADGLEQTIEAAAEPAPGAAMAEVAPPRIDDRKALLPDFDQARDGFGRMLEIGVHYGDGGAARMREPRINGDLLAEIPA